LHHFNVILGSKWILLAVTVSEEISDY